MKTRIEVLDFIKDQSNYGNSIVYATIGQGGCGLGISSYDISDDIEGMDFDGKVEPCDDIKESVHYDEQYNTVYQFSEESGLKYQIVTF